MVSIEQRTLNELEKIRYSVEERKSRVDSTEQRIVKAIEVMAETHPDAILPAVKSWTSCDARMGFECMLAHLLGSIVWHAILIEMVRANEDWNADFHRRIKTILGEIHFEDYELYDHCGIEEFCQERNLRKKFDQAVLNEARRAIGMKPVKITAA